MIFNRSSGQPGSRRLVAFIGGLTLAFSTTLWAQSGAEEAAAEISPEVFNLYLESRIQKPAGQATAEERAAVQEELTDLYLLSMQPEAAALRENPRINAQIELQTRAILAQAVASDFLANNPATDAEILASYEEQVALAPPVEFKAAHILVETQGTAMEVIGELDDGADFAELAREKSTGPSGENGGDLGWFTAESMVPEFSQAVAALDDGQYTEAPVQTQFGWHVILREDSREVSPPSLESVRDVVKQQVEQQKLQEYLAEIRGSAE